MKRSVTQFGSEVIKAPVYYLGGSMWITVDLTEASSPVRIAYEKSEVFRGLWYSTPFQTASGRHRLGEVKSLVRTWVKQNQGGGK